MAHVTCPHHACRVESKDWSEDDLKRTNVPEN